MIIKLTELELCQTKKKKDFREVLIKSKKKFKSAQKNTIKFIYLRISKKLKSKFLKFFKLGIYQKHIFFDGKKGQYIYEYN